MPSNRISRCRKVVRPNAPFASFGNLKGDPVLAVGYLILQGGDATPDTQPVLEFYRTQYGKWLLKGRAAEDLTMSTFFIRRMDAGLSGEDWHLVWGTRIGDTGARLRARLISFDGNSVRTIWERNDLVRGLITVTDKTVSLSYEKVYLSGERTHEILYITPNGLQ